MNSAEYLLVARIPPTLAAARKTYPGRSSENRRETAA